MNKQRIVRIAAFIVVAAIYVCARFWNLTSSCLWFDEIFSVHAAEHSWDSILNFVALDLIHPPLFYAVLKIWIAAGGESLFWLRTLPVIFSIIAVLPFFLLCRELRIGYWTSAMAFFLIAVNGSLIKYAQEVRMYSMLMCISLFSIWLFSRYLNKGIGIVALTLVNVALVYTHYFGWLVVMSEVAAILALQRIKWRPIVAMMLVSVVCFTPWLIAVIYAASSGSQLSQNIGWMQRPGILSLVQLALNLVEPFYFPVTSLDPSSVYRISIPLLLIFVVTFVLFLSRVSSIGEKQRSTIKLLILFGIVPIVLALLASWILPYSVWGTRHLVIVYVPFLLLTSTSVTYFSNYRLAACALTLIFLFSGYAFTTEFVRIKKPPVWCGFEDLAPKLQEAENGPIYVFEDLAAYHLWFAFRKFPDLKFRKCVFKIEGFPGMVEDKAYFIPRGLDDAYLISGKLSLGSLPNTMWIVYRAPQIDLTAPPLNTLSDQGFLVKRQEIYDGGESKVIAVFVEKR